VQWSEVSDLFLPEHNVTWSLSDIGDVSINTGAAKGYNIFNSTPVIALCGKVTTGIITVFKQ
jgi:hypothetical protein